MQQQFKDLFTGEAFREPPTAPNAPLGGPHGRMAGRRVLMLSFDTATVRSCSAKFDSHGRPTFTEPKRSDRPKEPAHAVGLMEQLANEAGTSLALILVDDGWQCLLADNHRWTKGPIEDRNRLLQKNPREVLSTAPKQDCSYTVVPNPGDEALRLFGFSLPNASQENGEPLINQTIEFSIPTKINRDIVELCDQAGLLPAMIQLTPAVILDYLAKRMFKPAFQDRDLVILGHAAAMIVTTEVNGRWLQARFHDSADPDSLDQYLRASLSQEHRDDPTKPCTIVNVTGRTYDLGGVPSTSLFPSTGVEPESLAPDFFCYVAP